MRRALFALVLLAAAPALAKPPAWDRKIDSPKRFKVLKAFDSAAVLDQETALVWERTPDAAIYSWSDASSHCAFLIVGERGGWRLPTVHEARSLVPLQTLPEGHPFSAAEVVYWTGTTLVTSDNDAFVIDLSPEDNNIGSAGKGGPFRAWCVRGGLGGSTD